MAAPHQVAECGFTLLVQEMVAHYGGEAEAGAEAEGDAAARVSPRLPSRPRPIPSRN